jgi:methylmalonyl-CoA mutase N-terminal domain/subunit
VERGETVIVGVNRFEDGESETVVAPPDYSALEQDQVARLREVRARRDGRAVQGALSALGDAAATYADASGKARAELMPCIVDAVRARASVGEISDVLRERWGAHRPDL